jgi:hypothetical protein
MLPKPEKMHSLCCFTGLGWVTAAVLLWLPPIGHGQRVPSCTTCCVGCPAAGSCHPHSKPTFLAPHYAYRAVLWLSLGALCAGIGRGPLSFVGWGDVHEGAHNFLQPRCPKLPCCCSARAPAAHAGVIPALQLGQVKGPLLVAGGVQWAPVSGGFHDARGSRLCVELVCYGMELLLLPEFCHGSERSSLDAHKYHASVQAGGPWTPTNAVASKPGWFHRGAAPPAHGACCCLWDATNDSLNMACVKGPPPVFPKDLASMRLRRALKAALPSAPK